MGQLPFALRLFTSATTGFRTRAVVGSEFPFSTHRSGGTTMAKSTKKAAKGKAAPKPKPKPAPAKKKAATKVVAKAKAVVAKVVAKVKPPKPAAAKPIAAAVDENGLGWVDAGKGYQLTLDA